MSEPLEQSRNYFQKEFLLESLEKFFEGGFLKEISEKDPVKFFGGMPESITGKILGRIYVGDPCFTSEEIPGENPGVILGKILVKSKEEF